MNLNYIFVTQATGSISSDNIVLKKYSRSKLNHKVGLSDVGDVQIKQFGLSYYCLPYFLFQ